MAEHRRKRPEQIAFTVMVLLVVFGLLAIAGLVAAPMPAVFP